MGEFEIEAENPRPGTASHRRGSADRPDGAGDAMLELGGRRVRLNPTDLATLEFESESDRSEGETEAKRSIEFERVRWREARTPQGGPPNIAPGGA